MKTSYERMTTHNNPQTLHDTVYHIPVLLHPSIDALNLKSGGIYADLTFGGGGHSREILRRMDATAQLYSFDQDADAQKNLHQNAAGLESDVTQDPRFTFVHANFRYLKNWMRYYQQEGLDGVLADLGVSSHHFDDETRGFSFRFDAPLDMRMNKDNPLSAAQIVNQYSESQLADILYRYGELRQARRMAATIVKQRAVNPIHTTFDLLQILEPFIRKDREKKEAACVFQALRMEVNHETEALEEALLAAVELLKPGGRLSVITYHSIEDRIVKNIIKTGLVSGKVQQDFFGRSTSPLKAINNKVIVPTEEEIAQNPRSRSAKLRIAEKIGS